MSEPIPAFTGEVQFRRYSDTSTQGASIVLGLHDRADIEAFIGKEGKRFMAVLVEIGDDEQPVQIDKPKGGSASKWLAMRCQEPEFWSFLHAGGYDVDDAESAAEACRKELEVSSRAEIDNDPAAMERFHTRLREPWIEWMSGEDRR